jgi:hypothetical protein
MSGIFEIFSVCLTTERTIPSFSSGMLWVKKIGYYRLHQAKQKADDWILILDESIGIGQEKLLVVLGIRRSQIDFSRPLKIQDMEPIILKSKKKWTGEDIAEVLKTCKKLVGAVLYATTDGNSTLKKGLRLSKIIHIYDVTHAIAIILEKLYKKDEEFKGFTNIMGQMRLKLCCSQYAHIIPPNQRSKSRFLNIDILSHWCMKILKALEKNNLSPQEKDLLQWVYDKKHFIEEMGQIIKITEELSKILKYNGLNKETKKKCLKILRNCKGTTKLKQYKTMFIEYLNNNTAQITKKGETILCSSDIIETTFGKYKNELSKNPMNGITDLALIIPAFTSSLEDKEIKESIDNCTRKMIKEWSNKNLCESLSVKRNLVLN